MTPKAIAIVGYAGRFPGADSSEALWNLVTERRSASADIPSDRWPVDRSEIVSAAGGPDRARSSRACLLDSFALEPSEVAPLGPSAGSLDEVTRLVLRVGIDAWSCARLRHVDRNRVGVILGNLALPTDSASELACEVLLPALGGDLQAMARRRITNPRAARPLALPAGALARCLNLGGGSYTLDAACASSLYALFLACAELEAGRLDAVVCGGIARPSSLYTQTGFTQLQALSPTGVCSPFDRAANGLVVGEGAGIFVLRRLEDAERDGNEVYATIRGVGVSNDTEGGILSPSKEGQLRAMRAAYAEAGWAPGDVELVECHGTGTPVGDGVELASLNELRRDQRSRCVIGSVKANIGHLLTAAGGAGLCKVLEAIRHRQLPPATHATASTARVELGELSLLPQAEAWPDRADRKPRRAAVSGFGFGGINAHVLLEDYRSHAGPLRQRARRRDDAVAIVGMSAHLGSLDSLGSFRDAVLQGRSVLAPVPENRWRGVQPIPVGGAWLSEVAVPLGRFKIPPRELAAMLPQQALMLRVAAEAVEDTRSSHPDQADTRTGVVVGLGLDLETTTFQARWIARQRARAQATTSDAWVDQVAESVGPALDASRTAGALTGLVASRIARELRFGGPSFTVSNEEGSGMRALEVAVRLLQTGAVDRAVAGAVDIAGDPRSVLATHGLRGFAAPGRCRPFDASSSGSAVGEGAVALVLKRRADAERDGDRIYACVTGLGSASAGSEYQAPLSSSCARAAAHAYRDAGVDPAQLDYLELHGSGDPYEDGAEIDGLSTVFPAAELPRCAVSSLTSTLGQAGAAGSLASVAKAALALAYEVTPPLPGFATPAHNRFASAGFHVLRESAAWHRNREDGARHAGVSSIGLDGTCHHAVLEAVASTVPPAPLSRPAALFLLRGAGDAERLSALAGSGSSLEEIAVSWHRARTSERVSRAIVAMSVDDLSSKLRASAPATRPLEGGVAIVFPGSGNHYLGMGQDLALALPSVYRADARPGARLRDELQVGRLAPWRASWPDDWENESLMALAAQPERALVAQVAHGIAVHDALLASGIRPAAYLGYSLGESAAFLASGTWADREVLFQRTLGSPLFRTALAGRRTFLREAWGDGAKWQAAVVGRSEAEIRPRLRGHLAILVVNSPRECVVGGEPGELRGLAEELGCEPFLIEGIPTVHFAEVSRVQDAYRALHELDATPPDGVGFYSAATGKRFVPTRASAAESIVTGAIRGLDFAAAVRSAYADGIRVFIEAGPQGSCTRMIGQTLEGLPHLAVSADTRGRNGFHCLLDALGRAAECGVEIDLDHLYDHELPAARPDRAHDALRIKVGGPPRRAPARPTLPDEGAPNNAPSHESGRAPVVMAGVSGAHEVFLRWARGSIELQTSLLLEQQALLAEIDPGSVPTALPRRARFERADCQRLATGRLSDVLGERFAAADAFPTRVRLPDEPLMLVDRIVDVEGTPGVLGPGRVVTEHDVREGAWYLDAGRAPVCISVEAGQADLFLSGYLGIDFETKGERVYRLLDARIAFHRELPRPGETLSYDIRIDRFIRQGDTWLFFFRFEGFADGEPLLTMTDGCAGFFSADQLAAGRGIVVDAPKPRSRQLGARPHTPLVAPFRESLAEAQVDALRSGDLRQAFGEGFTGRTLAPEQRLPSERMRLIDRVVEMDSGGGRYGLGTVHAEADITPDAWFLTCHFVDDPVMPGTLMYECCLHTLRTLLLRLGWNNAPGTLSSDFHYAPVPGVSSRLRCRGQVTPTTKRVSYRVDIKEIGYGPEPYVIADASMFADGRHIVEMEEMSVRLVSLSEASFTARVMTPETAPFPRERIVHFAEGQPSVAFGDRYRAFDTERRLARLPRDPFLFLDRVTSVDAKPWEMEPGGWIEGAFDVRRHGWYFAANRQSTLPFAVLLEAALQPCGWLAAYVGSALHSEDDLHFRNLDGDAVQLREVGADIGTLRTRARLTKATTAGGMIIQDYEMEVLAGSDPVYRGTTSFGFFSDGALANQVGLRAARKAPHLARGTPLPVSAGVVPGPDAPVEAEAARSLALPSRSFFMLDRLDELTLDGGAARLGFVAGSKTVDPSDWFFRAHFFQDPVMPGSLGLEALLQLLKLFGRERFGRLTSSHRFESMAVGQRHRWQYRGQIVPSHGQMDVQAQITRVEEGPAPLIVADGLLSVDGRPIYSMKDFALRLVPTGRS